MKTVKQIVAESMSISMWDIEVSEKAKKDAAKVAKEMNQVGKSLKSIVDEYASMKKFGSARGASMHRKAILRQLVKMKKISEIESKKAGY